MIVSEVSEFVQVGVRETLKEPVSKLGRSVMLGRKRE
jgi:hypothetical protein